MADWQAIKTEYITTDTSYRKLGEKYGIHYKLIGQRGKDENWVELRAQYKDETFTKTIDKISKQEVNRATRLRAVTDKMLDKIEAMIDSVNPEMCDPKSLRALSAALKDIKEIHGIRSDLDQREQNARIANLEKSANADEAVDKEITVTILGDLDAYSK